MHLIHLDKIGEEAARALKNGQRSVALAQDKLRQIWAAFDEAKKNKVSVLINGAKNKKEWAEHFNIGMRMCQYVIRDGSRKNQRKANSVRVVTLKVGKMVKVGDKEISLTREMLQMLVNEAEQKKEGTSTDTASAREATQ